MSLNITKCDTQLTKGNSNTYAQIVLSLRPTFSPNVTKFDNRLYFPIGSRPLLSFAIHFA